MPHRDDIEAIEDLHRKDVAATRAGDFEKLRSLMDEQCIVLPPDSEPESGQSYLDRVAPSGENESPEQIMELAQDWEELELFGDFAYERGIVRYAISDGKGDTVRETQRLIRILRRQEDGSWKVYRAMWHQPHAAS